MPTRNKSKSRDAKRGGTNKELKDFARSKMIARKLAKVAPDEDPGLVAGAIVLFASEVIKGSSSNLLEARAYLEGMRTTIDQLLVNAFSEPVPGQDRD